MPIFEIQGPDGKTYEADAPTMQAAAAAFGPKAPPAPPAPPSAVDTLIGKAKNLYGSVIEPALTMASGAVAKPVADTFGLAATAHDAITGQNGDPEGFQQSIKDALTYKPQTEGGQAAVNAAGALMHPIAAYANWAGDFYSNALRAVGAPDSVVSAVKDGETEAATQTLNFAGELPGQISNAVKAAAANKLRAIEANAAPNIKAAVANAQEVAPGLQTVAQTAGSPLLASIGRGAAGAKTVAASANIVDRLSSGLIDQAKSLAPVGISNPEVAGQVADVIAKKDADLQSRADTVYTEGRKAVAEEGKGQVLQTPNLLAAYQQLRAAVADKANLAPPPGVSAPTGGVRPSAPSPAPAGAPAPAPVIPGAPGRAVPGTPGYTIPAVSPVNVPGRAQGFDPLTLSPTGASPAHTIPGAPARAVPGTPGYSIPGSAPVPASPLTRTDALGTPLAPKGDFGLGAGQGVASPTPAAAPANAAQTRLDQFFDALAKKQRPTVSNVGTPGISWGDFYDLRKQLNTLYEDVPALDKTPASQAVFNQLKAAYYKDLEAAPDGAAKDITNTRNQIYAGLQDQREVLQNSVVASILGKDGAKALSDPDQALERIVGMRPSAQKYTRDMLETYAPDTLDSLRAYAITSHVEAATRGTAGAAVSKIDPTKLAPADLAKSGLFTDAQAAELSKRQDALNTALNALPQGGAASGADLPQALGRVAASGSGTFIGGLLAKFGGGSVLEKYLNTPEGRNALLAGPKTGPTAGPVKMFSAAVLAQVAAQRAQAAQAAQPPQQEAK